MMDIEAKFHIADLSEELNAKAISLPYSVRFLVLLLKCKTFIVIICVKRVIASVWLSFYRIA